VVENCLEQMQKWRADGLDLDVAINLSGKHLSDLDLPDRFAVALERWGVPPAQLLIEVAETSILTDPRRAASVLSQLRRIGIGVAIDDYGTGSSTPSWLERLEADELKIDRSFMRLDRTSSDAVIVASAVELGHQLGLRVVAEGVEDAATLTWLRGLGCDLAQGFQISRPIDADSVVLLAQRVAVAAGSPPPGVLRLVGSGG
jgi:EAL domain-containing protein (putative c-di-GMP-specific phosphodiesterase class I)